MSSPKVCSVVVAVIWCQHGLTGWPLHQHAPKGSVWKLCFTQQLGEQRHLEFIKYFVGDLNKFTLIICVVLLCIIMVS